jgi:hypothetical protein
MEFWSISILNFIVSLILLRSIGQFSQLKSLINEEDVQNQCLVWLRSQRPDSLSGKTFSNWIRSSLHSELNLTQPIIIHKRTAQRWLHYLGFAPNVYQQGLYFDGHERQDVMDYRKKFLVDISEYQRRMLSYVGDDLKIAVSRFA